MGQGPNQATISTTWVITVYQNSPPKDNLPTSQNSFGRFIYIFCFVVKKINSASRNFVISDQELFQLRSSVTKRKPRDWSLSHIEAQCRASHCSPPAATLQVQVGLNISARVSSHWPIKRLLWKPSLVKAVSNGVPAPCIRPTVSRVCPGSPGPETLVAPDSRRVGTRSGTPSCHSIAFHNSRIDCHCARRSTISIT